MKKLFLATALTFLSTQVVAGEYYSVYPYEDCVMPDESIKQDKGWFNVDNITAGKIYPAVIKTDNPAEAADMTVYELQKIAGEYQAAINTKEDQDLAEYCEALTPEEIQ